MIMTQEEKDLLLKDLCARLSYGVVVGTIDNDGSLSNFWTLDLYNRLTEDVIITHCELNADELTYFGDIRPYLFPLERMTEEQKLELATIKTYVSLNKNKEYLLFDWLNANHFDYRNLIDKKLAIDCTNLNIY